MLRQKTVLYSGALPPPQSSFSFFLSHYLSYHANESHGSHTHQILDKKHNAFKKHFFSELSENTGSLK